MALITRVSRLFRADLNAVLDRLEEPDTLLRQAVRDMEEAVIEQRQRIELAQHELEQRNSQQTSLTQRLTEIEEQLDVCLDADNDELASNLVRRKLEAQQQSNATNANIKSLQDNLTQWRARLAENESDLADMQQKLQMLQTNEAGLHESVTPPSTTSVRDEDVQVALLQEKQRRKQTGRRSS